MSNCETCEYAKRDSNGNYLYSCMRCGNCTYVEYREITRSRVLEAMRALLDVKPACKFTSQEEYMAYRLGVLTCIRILEREGGSNDT